MGASESQPQQEEVRGDDTPVAAKISPTTTETTTTATATTTLAPSFQEQQLQMERELTRLKEELNSSRATLNRRHVSEADARKAGGFRDTRTATMEDVPPMTTSSAATAVATPSSAATPSSTFFSSAATPIPTTFVHSPSPSQPRSRVRLAPDPPVAPAAPTLPLSPSESSEAAEEIEIHFPDAKKPKRHHSPIVSSTVTPVDVPPAYAAQLLAQPTSPFAQQQQSPLQNPYATPNYALDQFQLMRDTSEEVAHPYNNTNSLLFMQDEEEQHQHRMNYRDSFYTQMNATMNDSTNNDGDLIMTSNSFTLPATNSNESTKTASSSSNPTSSSSTRLLATPTEASRMKLESAISQRLLHKLEEHYLAGKITFDNVRYEMTMIYGGLEEEHEKELMEEFERMRVKSDESNSGQLSSSSDSSSISVIHRALSSLPAHTDVYTPSEPVEDDPDGIARLRLYTFASTDEFPPHTLLKAPKRGRCRGTSLEQSDTTVATVAALSSNSVTTTSVVSSPSDSSLPSSTSSSVVPPSSTTTSDQPRAIVHRMLYVNRAFERLTGLTQAQLRAFGLTASRFELSLRTDHYAPLHRINKRLRAEERLGGRMYQVRSWIDGIWVYCIVEWKAVVEFGRQTQAVVSIIPLPDNDPEHPMPPFVEGVDLDEDSLLYGYKPPGTERK